MTVKAVLFDLDGTLLSMDQDEFVKEYLIALVTFMAPHGYDPDALAKAIWKGTAAMVNNDGSEINEKAFWKVMKTAFPKKDLEADSSLFDKFYAEKFDGVGEKVSRVDPDALKTVKLIKEKGLPVVLATNPLFPSVATEKRIRWAGFDPSDFAFFTTYENSSYSKPNPDYYRSVAEKLGVECCECLMIGNDYIEDMIAQTLGMKVFLLTDHLYNAKDADLSRYPHGSFNDLIEYMKNIL